LLFNLSGTLLVYPFEPIRRIPLLFATKLANIAAESKGLAIAYVMILFYAIPVVFAVVHEMLG
jgi:sodium-dependent phosphate cotransporter